MPLMLGSFMNGLFSGAGGVLSTVSGVMGAANMIEGMQLGDKAADLMKQQADADFNTRGLQTWMDYSSKYGPESGAADTSSTTPSDTKTTAGPVKVPTQADIDKTIPNLPSHEGAPWYDSGRSDATIRQGAEAAQAGKAADAAKEMAKQPGVGATAGTTPGESPTSPIPYSAAARVARSLKGIVSPWTPEGTQQAIAAAPQPAPAAVAAPVPPPRLPGNTAPGGYNDPGIGPRPQQVQGPPVAPAPPPAPAPGGYFGTGGVGQLLSPQNPTYQVPRPAPTSYIPPQGSTPPQGANTEAVAPATDFQPGPAPTPGGTAPVPAAGIRGIGPAQPYGLERPQPTSIIPPSPEQASGRERGGVPLTQAEPPSIMQKVGNVLSGLNPIASAHAETAPGAAGAPAPENRPAAQEVPQTTSATPPKSASAPTGAGPVTVQGGKPVAPNQQGATVATETTPPVLAPPVNPRPYIWLHNNWKEGARMVDEAVQREGDNGVTVTPEQLAMHWWRESHFGTQAVTNQKSGALGPMQILPSTLKEIDPHGQLNVQDPRDALKLGTMYLKRLSSVYGLGSNTVATNYAYVVGPNHIPFVSKYGMDAEAKVNPDSIAYLQKTSYPGVKIDQSMFPNNAGRPNGGQYDVGQGVAAFNKSPDEGLNWLATTGPAGLAMGDRWRNFEGQFLSLAIKTGRYDMIQHIPDYVAQMSHQGALSNMAAADAALQRGDTQGAAQLLARAHAFFPDDTFGHFGVTKDGKQLWAQRLDERTGKTMGGPFQITHEALMSQMLAIQHPTTYVQTLQQHQKATAEIELARAHSEYYKQLPGIKEEGIQTRREIAEQTIQQRRDAADQRAATAQQTREIQLSRQDQDRREVDKMLTPDNEPVDTAANETPEAYANRVQLMHALMRNRPSGGAALTQPLARQYAQQYARGDLKLNPTTNKETGEQGWALTDPKTGEVRAYLGGDMGNQIRGLAGTRRLEKPTGQPQAGIGAGAGSQAALTQGRNQNLAGISLAA